jgi:hypothetical protein
MVAQTLVRLIAINLSLAVLVMELDAAARTVDPPLPATFRLTDGIRISGNLTAWDEQGIDGTFGQRPWSALQRDDLYRLFRRVMDRQDAGQWLTLGELMLQGDGRDKRGEDALRQAVRLDATLTERAETIRRETAKRLMAPAATEEAGAATALNSLSPELGPWTAERWPVLTPPELARGTAELKAELERLLAESATAADKPIENVETAGFVLYGDLSRQKLAEWSWQLEQAEQTLTKLLGVNKSVSPTAGKIVMVALTNRDRFDRIEREAFRQLVPSGQHGITHYRGPNAVVMLHVTDDSIATTDTLLRKAALAELHRYRSAARMPAWAAEGIAAFVAGDTVPDADPARDRLRAGRDFIRKDGNLAAALEVGYDHPTWATNEPTITAVGLLIIELMKRERPERFVAWVNAIKDGTPWLEALKTNFGASRDQLLSTVVAYYRVND